MRDNREKWSFYDLPARKALTAEQVVYWRNALSKLLKVGQEFEFNLPEKKNGSCKGDSNTCPCVNLSMENLCWQQCINKEGCHTIARSMTLCENVTANCEPEDCEGCTHFTAKCTGILCPNFISSCYVCPDFQTNCSDCAYRFDPNRNPDAIRKCLHDTLRPNNTYGQVNESGVHNITTDGSLLGKKGAEIITVGRRIDFWEFFKMAKKILDLASEKGAYFNERCSIHMHLLASYYGKVVPDPEKAGVPARVNEMEKDMPEIILANLHQLVRRYQNAMTWMMMGLNESERMTRWEKFRVSVLPVSAVMNHMREVQNEVSQHAGGNKYGWINYNNVQFSDNGDVNRFHVEFRGADGLMSPSACAALACMYYALAIKAVEISRYGVVEIGDVVWLDQAQKAKEAILNNMKGYQDGDRFADTRRVSEYRELYVAEALDLVRQLKSILIKIGPAYEVLEKLAERPCAIRRCEGQTWQQIEQDLAVITNEEDRFEIALSEIITLNQISECNTEAEWVEAVGSILRSDPQLAIDPDDAQVEDKVTEFITKNRDEGRLVWSTRIGAPIMI